MSYSVQINGWLHITFYSHLAYLSLESWWSHLWSFRLVLFPITVCEAVRTEAASSGPVLNCSTFTLPLPETYPLFNVLYAWMNCLDVHIDVFSSQVVRLHLVVVCLGHPWSFSSGILPVPAMPSKHCPFFFCKSVWSCENLVCAQSPARWELLGRSRHFCSGVWACNFSWTLRNVVSSFCGCICSLRFSHRYVIAGQMP